MNVILFDQGSLGFFAFSCSFDRLSFWVHFLLLQRFTFTFNDRFSLFTLALFCIFRRCLLHLWMSSFIRSRFFFTFLGCILSFFDVFCQNSSSPRFRSLHIDTLFWLNSIFDFLWLFFGYFLFLSTRNILI